MTTWRRLGVAVSVTLLVAGVSGLGAGCSKGSATPAGFDDDDAAGDSSIDAPGPSDARFGGSSDALELFDSGCATATGHVLRDPIYMLIVLDGSGSMAADEKWNAVVPALEALIDDLEMQGDRSFGLGLTIFSDTNDATAGKGPYPTMDIPVAFVDSAHAAALRGRLDGAMPKNETPTLAVMTGQYAELESFVPPAPLLPAGKKVMVLMTDGVPYPDPDTQKPMCITAAQAELAKAAPLGPVTTFAVGIGYPFPYDPLVYDVAFMGALAVAGGAPNDGCQADELKYADNMCHLQVTPTSNGTPAQLEQEFAIAFDKIRSKIATCDLTLDKVDGGMVDPTRVNVLFTDALGNSRVFYEDPTDGWSYDNPANPSKVVLHGKSCAELKSNPSGKIQVVLGCQTLVK